MTNNAAEGAYMSHLFTNSEALKWAMTSSPQPPLPPPPPPMMNRNNWAFNCYVEPPFTTCLNEIGRQKRIGKIQIIGSSKMFIKSKQQNIFLQSLFKNFFPVVFIFLSLSR